MTKVSARCFSHTKPTGGSSTGPPTPKQSALYYGTVLFVYRKEGADIPIYKRCSRCGKRLQSGTTCDCMKQRYREYDRHSRDQKAKNFYGSSEWTKARAAVLELDGGIDVYIFMTTGEILLADTVHHIFPLRDDWEKRLDKDNLMSLNHGTHSMIEQEYKKNKTEMIEKLQEMLAKFRSEMR